MDEHHAVLLLATDISTAPLPEAIQTQSVDVQHTVVENFGIDDARTLIAAAATRPIELQQKIFVVAFSTATSEAQNALLKLLEEPPVTSRFYLVVPHETVLIETVRSRLSVPDTRTSTKSPVALEFLAMSYQERMQTIATKAKEKDTLWMRSVLHGIEVIASASKDLMHPAVALCARYADIRGASRKMLLEDLALSLPPQYTKV
ncbi:hypothetical protein KC722_00335 [Candidatus Kaiserbacteria bacterium]|nr:hypothetical protein [Candidatus Kaiserbacteria bacterium]MCB9811957.1 hypothetical protein [Candidatus Nomurabacteria bacterium]